MNDVTEPDPVGPAPIYTPPDVAQLPGNPKVRNLAVAILVALNAGLALLTSLGVVHWTAAQTALVYAEANTATVLLLSLYAHLAPGTKKEPVALGGSFIAVVVATTSLLSGFHLWSLTTAQNGVVVTFAATVVTVGAVVFTRSQVAPVQ